MITTQTRMHFSENANAQILQYVVLYKHTLTNALTDTHAHTFYLHDFYHYSHLIYIIAK